MYEPDFPYFEWRLDRWKIGFALLLFVGLLYFRGSLSTSPGVIPTEPIADQTPEGGGGAAPDSAVIPTNTPSVSAAPTPELPPIPMPTPGQPTLTLRVLGEPLPPLLTRNPLFYGETSLPNQPLELRVGAQRLTTRSDAWGRWQIALVEPLASGQNWVRARIAPGAENGSGAMQSLIVTIGPEAEEILPPLILPLLLNEEGSSQPTLRGNGVPGAELAIEGGLVGDEVKRLTQVRAGSDGRWQWSPSEPLAPGIYEFRAVHLSPQGRPLSRSEPFRLQVIG